MLRGFAVKRVMSDNSDDDIWARVRKEAVAKTDGQESLDQKPPYADRTETEFEITSAERTRGSLEKRKAGDPANHKMTWETTEEEVDGPPRPTKRRKRSKPVPTILIGSTIVALLWVLGAGLFLMQNASTFGANGSTLLFSLLVLLLGPAFSLLAGFMGESMAKSNRHAQSLIAAARKMLEPDQTGEKAVRTTALAVRGEIGRLEGAIGEVTDRLRLIEGNVESQASALSAAGNSARGGADQLVATMENERQRLDDLLAAMAQLTTQAQASTQAAGQSIDERAAKLAIAADSLVDKSNLASDAAAGAAQRLEVAAQRAVDAIEQLDQAAGRGETALARAHDLMVLARVRADEAVGSVSHAVSSLHDAAASASETARVVSETIQSESAASRDAGLETLEQIRAATVSNAQMVTEALRQEAEAARIAGAETLAALQASADAVRFAADEARQQSNQQTADNQRQMDSVRQTAFEAGKEADAFMQTRINDARSLIEQSAGLLDETGAKIQERFGRLAAACSDQARAVEDLLDTLDRRLENLPQEAEARAQAIETALNDTLSRLTQAGKKAAAETAALDSAFQDRLRDSYSALGEVVQRLGGLSGVLSVQPPLALRPVQAAPEKIPETLAPSPPAPAAVVEAPQPIALQAQPAETQQAIAPVQTPVPKSFQPLQSAPTAPPPASQPIAPQPSVSLHQPDQALVMRPSGLKISSPMPIEDDPFAELQIGRSPPQSSGSENGWSWKQVLSTLDEKGGKSEQIKVSDLLKELGLETAISDSDLDKLRALANRSRDQARRGTREMVPNEVRAMRRKLTSNPELRASVVRFVDARREAAARGKLAGNEARVYLVADAALEA